MKMLTRIKLSGFKSIREMDLELRPLNVLIGANGAGKSNLISFLKMLREGMNGRLQEFVAREGGAGALLHRGAEDAHDIRGLVGIRDANTDTHYEVVLAGPDKLLPVIDHILPPVSAHESGFVMGDAAHELLLPRQAREGGAEARRVHDVLSNCAIYHLDNTSERAGFRTQGYIHDNHELASDGRNLAAYLYMLREMHRPYYDRIVDTIRLVAPFFDDFVIAPLELRPEDVKLDWRARGSDNLFGPHQLSDGTLRMMALITLLLQPEERLPAIIAIDEPELGLHPYALEVVASLLSSASVSSQIIVATQSAGLVDFFEPEDIVVADLQEGASQFRRLPAGELTGWLERYSLGELWEKNVLGGRPA